MHLDITLSMYNDKCILSRVNCVVTVSESHPAVTELQGEESRFVDILHYIQSLFPPGYSSFEIWREQIFDIRRHIKQKTPRWRGSEEIFEEKICCVDNKIYLNPWRRRSSHKPNAWYP